MTDSASSFGGDKKVGRSVLSGFESVLKRWAVPRIPSGVETHHLTFMTLVWSLLNVALGFIAEKHLSALWLVSLMILLQYLTDLLDGELGRVRKTGLIKWGFHMDHFLDYIFICSLVFVGYKISPDGLEIWYFALVVILGGFMVNSFLSFAATNEFRIYHLGIGPTEMRIVFIFINTVIIYIGTDEFHILLPLVVVLCLLGLVFNTYQIHRRLWRMDMQAKKETSL